MGLRTINDPSGLNIPLVERLIGMTAYDIVKYVAMNIDDIKDVVGATEQVGADKAAVLVALTQALEAAAEAGQAKLLVQAVNNTYFEDRLNPPPVDADNNDTYWVHQNKRLFLARNVNGLGVETGVEFITEGFLENVDGGNIGFDPDQNYTVGTIGAQLLAYGLSIQAAVQEAATAGATSAAAVDAANGARNRQNHTGIQAISTVAGLQDALDTAVAVGNDLRDELADVMGLDLTGFRQVGASAQARTGLEKMRDWVNVRDFMTEEQITQADTGNFPDCTTAFAAAQAASKHVRVPPGSYGLVNLRILNSRWIIGAGRDCCFLRQLDATKPAINCLSDASVGQLKGIRINGFYVLGAPEYANRGAGVSPVPGGAAAVVVAGYGAYAVWDSYFGFFAKNTRTAIEVNGPEAANVFESEFHITSEGTRMTAAILNGGAYNTVKMFLTQCDNFAVTCSFNGSDIRVVSENCQYYNGQGNVIRAEVEGIAAAFIPTEAVIYDEGFYNVYIKPTCNLLPVDAGRISYAFRMFYGSVMITPQILQIRPTWPLKPNFFPSSIIGGVRGACPGKIEGNHSFYHQRILSVQGDMVDWSSRKANTKVTQYLAPSAPFNIQVNVLTDNVIINPTTAITLVGISFVQYSYPGAYSGDGSFEAANIPDGQRFTFSTTQNLLGIVWGDTGSLLPTNIDANTSLTIIYSADAGKFLVA